MPHEALGYVLAQLKQMPAAKEQFEKAIALGDSNPEVKENLAKVLASLGKQN
jgi:Flp pilus assembly protein TadD